MRHRTKRGRVRWIGERGRVKTLKTVETVKPRR